MFSPQWELKKPNNSKNNRSNIRWQNNSNNADDIETCLLVKKCSNRYNKVTIKSFLSNSSSEQEFVNSNVYQKESIN